MLVNNPVLKPTNTTVSVEIASINVMETLWVDKSINDITLAFTCNSGTSPIEFKWTFANQTVRDNEYDLIVGTTAQYGAKDFSNLFLVPSEQVINIAGKNIIPPAINVHRITGIDRPNAVEVVVYYDSVDPYPNMTWLFATSGEADTVFNDISTLVADMSATGGGTNNWGLANIVLDADRAHKMVTFDMTIETGTNKSTSYINIPNSGAVEIKNDSSDNFLVQIKDAAGAVKTFFSAATSYFMGQLGVGVAAVNSKAAFEVSSTTQGSLPARMTTTQRNLITGLGVSHEGLTIYNLTDKEYQTWDDSSWVSSGVSLFTGLTDTPSTYSGQGLKSTRVNVGESAMEFFTPPTPGSTTFLGLTDTPASFSAQALKGVRVNAAMTALEYTTFAGTGKFAIFDSSGVPTFYDTLVAAISGGSAGDTIQQFANFTTTVEANFNKAINLNMNGFKYTNNSTGTENTFNFAGTGMGTMHLYNGVIRREGSTETGLSENTALVTDDSDWIIECAGIVVHSDGAHNTLRTHAIVRGDITVICDAGVGTAAVLYYGTKESALNGMRIYNYSNGYGLLQSGNNPIDDIWIYCETGIGIEHAGKFTNSFVHCDGALGVYMNNLNAKMRKCYILSNGGFAVTTENVGQEIDDCYIESTSHTALKLEDDCRAEGVQCISSSSAGIQTNGENVRVYNFYAETRGSARALYISNDLLFADISNGVAYNSWNNATGDSITIDNLAANDVRLSNISCRVTNSAAECIGSNGAVTIKYGDMKFDRLAVVKVHANISQGLVAADAIDAYGNLKL